MKQANNINLHIEPPPLAKTQRLCVVIFNVEEKISQGSPPE